MGDRWRQLLVRRRGPIDSVADLVNGGSRSAISSRAVSRSSAGDMRGLVVWRMRGERYDGIGRAASACASAPSTATSVGRPRPRVIRLASTYDRRHHIAGKQIARS
jgi:hypothetical protein